VDEAGPGDVRGLDRFFPDALIQRPIGKWGESVFVEEIARMFHRLSSCELSRNNVPLFSYNEKTPNLTGCPRQVR